MPRNLTKTNLEYLIYMYTEDLALNNRKWLSHKTQPDQNKPETFVADIVNLS